MHIEGKVVSFEDVSAVVKKISAEIAWDEVSKEIEKAYKDLQKHVSVRGFRQGKVPRAILEKQYSESIKAETARELATHFLEHCLEEKGVIPVAAPVIESYKFNDGTNLEFVAKIESRPNVELENYRGIEIADRKVSVTEEEIAGELEKIRQMHAQIHPVEGRDTTASGDVVYFDITELKADGSAGKKESMNASLGEGRVNPVLESRLTGIKIGETVEIDLSAKEGEPKRFRITPTEIKQKVLPEMNDDFAKDLGEFANLQAIKDRISENIVKTKSDRSKADSEEELIKEIISRNPFPVPESLVERQLGLFAENFQKSFGMKNLNMDQFRSEMSPRAQYVVQRAFVLDAVAKREGIDANDEDVEAEFKRIAKESGRNTMWVRAQYEKEGSIEDLKYQLRDRKVVEYLLGEAKKVEKPALDAVSDPVIE